MSDTVLRSNLMEYAGDLITLKLVSVSHTLWADANSKGVCVHTAGGWGGAHCSYIMQIQSRIVIRATEQVPVL